MQWTRTLGALLLLVAATVAPGSTQVGAPAAQPSFEVASVRRNTSGAPGGSWAGRGSQLSIVNYRLRDIILGAYQIRPNQLVGGPGWIDSERFDIQAKAPDGVARDIAMLRTLLEQRFGLRTHSERREMPVFALVVARADGRAGPQLRRSAQDCDAARAARARGQTPMPPPGIGKAPFCSAYTVPGRLDAGGYSMSEVARLLTNDAGRLVVDRTGLPGLYDIELSWMPANGSAETPADAGGVGLFTALQEQLGLKLEPSTGPVDVLVIDAVERPVPD